ncbi:acyltransferase family protein [uncultured Duncaniella sp.]|uniref:acyltransferase family protein n=1 Tax=uncultured Duncaniella sp. TaxID=2768039 RepID=UPI00339D54C0
MVKIIAMFGVICWHTTRQFVNLQSVEFSLASFLYRTAAISIPLFFLSSGYLQLGRNKCSWSYSFRKIVRILRYVIIFCITYWFLQSLRYGVDFKNLWLIVSDSFIGVGPFYVFWYFGAMILIYLLLPMLNRLFLYKNHFVVMTMVMLLIQNCVHLQLLTNGGGMKTSALPSGCIIG